MKTIYSEVIFFQHYGWCRDVDYSRTETQLNSETVRELRYGGSARVEARYLNDVNLRLVVVVIQLPGGLDFDDVIRAIDVPLERRTLCVEDSKAGVIRRAIAIADSFKIALEYSSPCPASMLGQQRAVEREKADLPF